ncbi:PqqD family protein [Desulforhopalus singaporensis]|uniref:Coenzyme PQQ synthesis protein D (PqqD) n=1 Tax=Desulforhopalus singaporensis TaxID=91360 RepID=A0A1H0VLP4_9BACT|nr:PqqD family protein [Desulforhopalus singaporensis]SDP79360.1 Coenzyme PQQ synthesis protein D (PqqD) [Desulforhopalus singaporensis]
MNGEQKPVLNKDYTIEKFDNEILLYSEVGTQALYLNDTAYLIWVLCEKDITVNQIVSSLEEIYPDNKGRLRSEVESTLEMLRSSGAVTLEDE